MGSVLYLAIIQSISLLQFMHTLRCDKLGPFFNNTRPPYGRQGLAGYLGKGNIFFLTNKSVFLNEQKIRKLSRGVNKERFPSHPVNFFICLQHQQQQQQHQQQQQQQTGLLIKCLFFVTYTFRHSQGDPTDL